MPSERAQCLIFFAKPTYTSWYMLADGQEIMHPVFRGLLNDAPEGIYAFLPEAFINNHPDVMLEFQKNKIHVLQGEDEPQILAKSNKQVLEYIEIFLDDSPTATLDPMLVVCDEVDACLLFRLFSKTPIQLRRKTDETTRVTRVTPQMNSKVMKRFLSKNFSLRRPFYKEIKTDMNIIFTAAYSEQPVIVLGLASDYGMDINCYDDGSGCFTPLHCAAIEGHASTVQAMIDMGATVDIKTEDGGTALHLAANHEETARILLENGADIHAKQDDGSTPLHVAASYRGSSAVVRLLIEKGAVVDAKDNSGQTPLHKAASRETIEALLQNGANPNAVNANQWTPILTSRADSVGMVKVFLKYGARVDIKLDGDSVLDVASRQDRHQVLQYLLERCFLDPVLLGDSLKAVSYNDSDSGSDIGANDVLRPHVQKIQTLNLQSHNFSNFDPARFQCAKIPAEFRCDCEVEVARMKSQTLCETHLTVYDVLEKNDFELACLLRNNSFAQLAESDEWMEQYPIYGSILTCHFENGKLRKSLQEEGMTICSRLFPTTNRPLPDEIKDKIIRYLNNDDLFNLKRTVPVSASQVKR